MDIQPARIHFIEHSLKFSRNKWSSYETKFHCIFCTSYFILPFKCIQIYLFQTFFHCATILHKVVLLWIFHSPSHSIISSYRREMSVNKHRSFNKSRPPTLHFLLAMKNQTRLRQKATWNGEFARAETKIKQFHSASKKEKKRNSDEGKVGEWGSKNSETLAKKHTGDGTHFQRADGLSRH